MIGTTSKDPLVQMRQWCFVGIVYFGFRLYWEFGLYEKMRKMDEEALTNHFNKSA